MQKYIVCCALMLLSTAQAAKVENGKVSVNSGESLATVLDEIARAEGFAINRLSSDEDAVSIGFRQTPVEEALKRLLRDQNAMIVRNAEGKIERINLFAKGKPITAVNGQSTLTANDQGQFSLDVKLNNQTTSALIDTGANTSAISSATLQRLGLSADREERIEINTAGGKVEGFKVRIPSMEIAGKTFNDRMVLMIPTLKEDMLIGTDLLMEFKILHQGNRMEMTAHEK